jgi:hypothetical protein
MDLADQPCFFSFLRANVPVNAKFFVLENDAEFE